MTTDTSAEALEESIFWLKAKYRRHGEIEDRIAAEQLEYFQAEKRRAREGVTDEVVQRACEAYLHPAVRSWPVDHTAMRAALEAVWPDGRDAKDAARYRWLRTHFRFANDSMHEVWFDASLEPNDSGVPADLDMEIDSAMKDTDHD